MLTEETLMRPKHDPLTDFAKIKGVQEIFRKIDIKELMNKNNVQDFNKIEKFKNSKIGENRIWRCSCSLEDKHFLYHVKKLMQQKKNQYERDLIQLFFTVHKLKNGH